MKFNFKKISAIASSVLLTGMTMGVAAAAAFPAPFKAAGASGTAVVYGASADALDATQANSIANYLASQMPSASGTMTGGDSLLLDKGEKARFTLDVDVTSIYSTLDENQLSTVLADGIYLNDNNDEYKYTQDIRLYNKLNLTHFRDTSSPFEYEPTIGIELAKGVSILNYTLDFTTAAVGTSDWSKLENTDIQILGKNFFISDVSASTLSAGGLKMTLLDSANTATISEGETKEVIVGGKTYSVAIEALSGTAGATSAKARLRVNGELTNSLLGGQTYKLSDGTYVGVKEVSMRDVAGNIASVEFSIGTGQIIVENGQTLEINSEDVTDLEDSNGYSYNVIARITNTSTTVEDIKFEWITNTKVWLGSGVEIAMPGIEAIKLSMGDFIKPVEEKTVLKDGSDSLEVSTYIYDGMVNLHLLYTNSSVTGFEGLGEDSSRKLVTNSSTSPTLALNESEDSYFVATWISGNQGETYAFEISKIDLSSGKNATTLKNLVAGGGDVEISEVSKTKDYGQITFTLVESNDADGAAKVKITPVGGSGTVYADRVVTNEGMQFRLPVISATLATDGYINFTSGAVTTTWDMNFTEEDSSGNIQVGKSFTATVGIDAGDGVEVTATSLSELEVGRGTKVYEAYVNSPLATKILWDRPTSGLNELEVTYHGDDAYGQVYISEIGASSTGVSAGSMVFTDAERSSWSNKNVVLVGGNCVNSATAEVLGISMDNCLSTFTAKTGADSGKYFIGSYADKFTTGKIALVVAGYTKEDTAAAASYLITNTVETTAGKPGVGQTGLTGAYSFVQN